MSAFLDSLLVEEESMVVLGPWLNLRYNGRLVWLRGNALMRLLQFGGVGDAIACTAEGEALGIELKAERANKHGNFFLELFSDLNVVGGSCRQGWMQTSLAQRLLYYFLDQDELYEFDFPALRHWALEQGNLWRFAWKQQSQREQRNRTYGFVVPIRVLIQALNPVHARPLHELRAVA